MAGRARRSRPGLDVHTPKRLHSHDAITLDGIPVTSLARTLLDLAAVVPFTQLKRAYERAERLRILDMDAIHDLLARSNGHRGVGAMKQLVAYDPAPAAGAASELERLFFDLIATTDLPSPKPNALVEGFVVDAYWPEARLVVELQGYAFHSDPATFERDHVKRGRLKLAGLDVLPLTYDQVTREAGETVATVRELYARGLRSR